MEEINIEKSIRKGRLIYKKGLIDLISGLLVNVIVMLWFPAVGLGLLIDSLNGFDNNPSTTQIFVEISITIIFLFLGYLIIKKYLIIDNFIRIKGNSFERNREVLREITKDSDWIVMNDNKRYFWAMNNSGFSAGRQLFVLYENDYILCNSTTFGLHGLKSPFHFLGDKKLIDYLTVEIQKNI